MCDDIQKYCRICLDVDSDHVFILGDPTICLHLKSCLTVTVLPNDNLPKAICLSCVSHLSQFYNFQLNARCSQDWLESSMEELLKKSIETKAHIQPLPDSEYNSDSLLEFLNNTANIEEYLNNLGKEDIPSIVNMLDKNEHSVDAGKVYSLKCKASSPKKKEILKNCKMKMEIDVLDSEVKIVKEIIIKEPEPKVNNNCKTDINFLTCYGCKTKFDSIQKLSQHINTCINCQTLFDSKQKMQQHIITHNILLPYPVISDCGEQLQSQEHIQHHKISHNDFGISSGSVYRCKECGDTFKDRFLIYKHAIEHIAKSKQKVCDICGHNFASNDALIKHKKEDHKKCDNFIYRCKICNHTSSNRKEMYLHVKKHTERPAPRRHLCESCGCSFATKASLTRHLSHHDHSESKCRMCNARCANEKELATHVLGHVELVMCEKCGHTIVNQELGEHKCV